MTPSKHTQKSIINFDTKLLPYPSSLVVFFPGMGVGGRYIIYLLKFFLLSLSVGPVFQT